MSETIAAERPDINTEDRDTEWHNYGDGDPENHGGRFVKWSPDEEEWTVVETQPVADMGIPEKEPGEQYVTDYIVEPDHVFDLSNEHGWSDVMVDIFESFNKSVIYRADDWPEVLENLEYYLVDIPWKRGIEGRNHSMTEYWEELEEKYGITPDHV